MLRSPVRPRSITSASEKTSTLTLIRTPCHERGVSPDRAVIDTSVVIALDELDPVLLPREMAISTLTLAELTCGPHSTRDVLERSRRQDQLQRAEANLEPLPFDAVCARAFGVICTAVAAAGRKVGGSRIMDLMIASTALANQLPLYTLNPADLTGLEALLEIVDLS